MISLTCDMESERVKLTEPESRRVVARELRRGEWKVLVKGYKLSLMAWS